jgi:hypothetical protein
VAPPPADELPDAMLRLEAALGADLTQLLVKALAGGYRARPERGRSAPQIRTNT